MKKTNTKIKVKNNLDQYQNIDIYYFGNHKEGGIIICRPDKKKYTVIPIKKI